jgi:dihydroneopterin aldolase
MMDASDSPGSPDRIELRGLRVVGTHGVLVEEQTRPQPFEIDLDVEADLRAASASDRLDDTLDYAMLATRAAAVVSDEHHALLERVAERIADVILADGRVRRVAVTVRKLRPPVPLDLATSAVRLVRP